MKQVVFDGQIFASWTLDEALAAASEAFDEGTVAAIRQALEEGGEVALATCETHAEGQLAARRFRQCGLQVRLQEAAGSAAAAHSGGDGLTASAPAADGGARSRKSARPSATVASAAVAAVLVVAGAGGWYGYAQWRSGAEDAGGTTTADAGDASRADAKSQDSSDAASAELEVTTESQAASAIPAFDHWENTDAFQWQSGPFGARVASAGLADDGSATLSLRLQGRALPHVGMRSRRLRYRIDEVTDSAGTSLCAEAGCVKGQSAEWQGFTGPAGGNVKREDGTQESYETFNAKPVIRLAPDARVRDVARITGRIVYDLPTEITTYRVPASATDKTMDGKGLSVVLNQVQGRKVRYSLNGDRKRLLAMRAFNADGDTLDQQRRLGQRTGNGAVQYRATYDGEVAAVAYVLASRVEAQRYTFQLDTAYPPMGAPNANRSPLAWPEPAKEPPLAEHMDAKPPEASPKTAMFVNNKPTSAVGPMRLQLQSLRKWGRDRLFGSILFAVPESVPLANRLNALRLRVTKAITPAGEVPIDYILPLLPLPQGFNPVLQGPGSSDFQMEPFDGDSASALKGEVVFRDAQDVSTHEMDAVPGAQASFNGVTLQVRRWLREVDRSPFHPAVSLRISGATHRLVAVAAYNEAGERIDGEIETFRGVGDELAITMPVAAEPASVRVMVADKAPAFTRTVTLETDD